MKYFGILKEKDLTGFSIVEIENYLLEIEAYENNFTDETIQKMFIRDFELEFDEIDTTYRPTLSLINEFIEFLFEKYQLTIFLDKYFIDFNNEIYGLELIEQKKIALNEFNNWYDKLNIETPDIINKSKSVNGIEKTLSEGKLYKVYLDLLKLKSQITITENILPFLIGDSDFYDYDFLKKESITETLNFNSISKILSQLNDRFCFEKDKYFTGYFSDSFIYEEYKNIFNSVEICHFTNQYLRSIEDLLPSHIYALYEFLNEHNMIKKSETKFIEFVFKEYKLRLSKIHNYNNKKENLKHNDKKEYIENLWKSFSKKE